MQAGPPHGAQETEVTVLHKATGEHMLEKTVNELFSRERAVFEFVRLGSPILESDQGKFHVSGVHHLDETAIANGHVINIRSQILQRAVCPLPTGLQCTTQSLYQTQGGVLGKDWGFTQEMLEASPKQLGQCFHRQEEILPRLAPSIAGQKISRHPERDNEHGDGKPDYTSTYCKMPTKPIWPPMKRGSRARI